MSQTPTPPGAAPQQPGSEAGGLAHRRPRPARRHHRRHDPLLPAGGPAAAGRAGGPGEPLLPRAPRPARADQGAAVPAVLAGRDQGPPDRRARGDDRGHLRRRRRPHVHARRAAGALRDRRRALPGDPLVGPPPRAGRVRPRRVRRRRPRLPPHPRLAARPRHAHAGRRRDRARRTPRASRRRSRASSTCSPPVARCGGRTTSCGSSRTSPRATRPTSSPSPTAWSTTRTSARSSA